MMADLAAATAVDAAVARLSVLGAEYKAALTFASDTALRDETERLVIPLRDAVAELDRRFAAVTHPADRAELTPLVESIRRWPTELERARDELLATAPDAGPRTLRAAEELARTDRAAALALESYRRFRAGWELVDSPDEPATVIAFLVARRTLEDAEGRLGEVLRGEASGADGRTALDAVRASVEPAVRDVRAAAARIDAARRSSAERWADGQARAMDALVHIADAATGPEERGRQHLVYSRAKADALAALAEYTAATAALVAHRGP